jgi:hypothetical protein
VANESERTAEGTPSVKNVACVECKTRNTVDVDATDIACSACNAPAHSASCSGCARKTWIWGSPRSGARWTCPGCGVKNTVDWTAEDDAPSARLDPEPAAPTTAPASAQGIGCPNCGVALFSPKPAICPNCGGSTAGGSATSAASPVAPRQALAPPAAAAWNPPQKRRGGFAKGCLLSLGIIAAIAVIIGIVVAVAAHNVSKKVSSNASTGDLGGPAPAADYTVGQTASTGGWRVTVYSFKDPYTPPDTAFNASAGQHYVTVDVQVTNSDANKAQTFSSLAGFHLLDSSNHQYDETIVAELSPSAPDGEVQAGQSIRGYVAFEVPDGTSGLRFRAQGSLTAAGAVFTLS